MSIIHIARLGSYNLRILLTVCKLSSMTAFSPNKLLIGIAACGVPQRTLMDTAAAWRDLAGARDADIKTALFCDTSDGIVDFSALGEAFDSVTWNEKRLGLGTARSAMVAAAALEPNTALVIMDGDGQFEPAALAPVIDALGTGDFDIVLPQRKTRHLPAAPGLGIDRLLAEYFQSFCVAKSSSHPARARADLQPGAFALAPLAVAEACHWRLPRDFSWDLAFSAAVLESPLRIGWIEVETAVQTTTLYGADGFEAVTRFLVSKYGRGKVVSAAAEFAADPFIAARFSQDGISSLVDSISQVDSTENTV